MNSFLKDKQIRLRCKKDYSEAHTHIIIGKVVEENSTYIVVKGRTFHFKDILSGKRSAVHAGDTMVRVIPWSNVEIVHWISSKSDWEADFDFDKAGNLVLADKPQTVICARRDSAQ